MSAPISKQEAATIDPFHTPPPCTVTLGFDEQAYLATYDDVIVSLDTGEFESAQEHFERFGRKEGRHADERYIRALGLGPADSLLRDSAPISIDTVIFGAGGTALIVGWTDDRDSGLESLSILADHEHGWNTTAFGRVRRIDVELALQAPPGHQFGFWAVVRLIAGLPTRQLWAIRGRLADGRYRQTDCSVRPVSDIELRSTILTYSAAAEFLGNRYIESFLALDSGIGAELVALNRRITENILAGAWVSTYGPTGPFLGSIIVCLFGRSEFLFLQAALFSLAPGFRDYEFVFVSIRHML